MEITSLTHTILATALLRTSPVALAGLTMGGERRRRRERRTLKLNQFNPDELILRLCLNRLHLSFPIFPLLSAAASFCYLHVSFRCDTDSAYWVWHFLNLI